METPNYITEEVTIHEKRDNSALMIRASAFVVAFALAAGAAVIVLNTGSHPTQVAQAPVEETQAPAQPQQLASNDIAQPPVAAPAPVTPPAPAPRAEVRREAPVRHAVSPTPFTPAAPITPNVIETPPAIDTAPPADAAPANPQIGALQEPQPAG